MILSLDIIFSNWRPVKIQMRFQEDFGYNVQESSKIKQQRRTDPLQLNFLWFVIWKLIIVWKRRKNILYSRLPGNDIIKVKYITDTEIRIHK